MNLNENPLFTLELMNLPVNYNYSHYFAQVNTNTQENQVLISQRIEDVDILGDMREAWDNFIETGQVWALLIGLFVGYMFRGMTSF